MDPGLEIAGMTDKKAGVRALTMCVLVYEPRNSFGLDVVRRNRPRREQGEIA